MTIVSVEAVYPLKGQRLARLKHLENLDRHSLQDDLQGFVEMNGVPETFNLRVHSNDPDAGPFYEAFGRFQLRKKVHRGRNGARSQVWVGRPISRGSKVSGITIPLDQTAGRKITISPVGIVRESTILLST